MKAVRQEGIASKMPENMSWAAIATQDWKQMGGMLDALIDIITSKEVEDMAFKCMERCTYNNEKITRDTFEKEERRGDFFPVAFKVITENIRPFMSRLLSGLQAESPKEKKPSQA